MKGRLKRHNRKFQKKLKAHLGRRKTHGRKSTRKSRGSRRGGKRARSAGAPRTDTGTGAQLFAKKNSVLFKSRLSGTKRLLREVRANENFSKQRITAIAPYRNKSARPLNSLGSALVYEIGGGANWLYNTVNATTNIETAPVYLMDLTSSLNLQNGNQTTYPVVSRLGFNVNTVPGPEASVVWVPCFTQGPTGAGGTQPSWVLEDTALQSSAIYPGNKSMLRKTDIDMFFYGAGQYATEFCIQLIQLKEDYLHPSQDVTLAAGGPLADTSQNNTAFWQWYAKGYSAHPLSELDPSQARHLKVLSEKKFTLQQVVSNEALINNGGFQLMTTTGVTPGSGPTQSDLVIGHNQRVKMSLPWDKMCSFDWMKNSLETVGPSVAGSFAQQTGNVQGCVRPKARVYLAIRALNPVTTTLFTGTGGAIGVSPYNTPSFDFKIRNTWCQLA